MQTKVWYRKDMFNFNAAWPADYDMVYDSDIMEPDGTLELKETIEGGCEFMFDLMNDEIAHDIYVRSMSVGDAVQFGEVVMLCMPSGWKQI